MKHNLFLDAGLVLTNECLIDTKKEKNVIVNHYYVQDKLVSKIKHGKGDYFTIKFDDIAFYRDDKVIANVLKKILRLFLKKYHKGGTILILGLGNSSILGDSFGVKCLNNIIATNHYNDIYMIPKAAYFECGS